MFKMNSIPNLISFLLATILISDPASSEEPRSWDDLSIAREILRYEIPTLLPKNLRESMDFVRIDSEKSLYTVEKGDVIYIPLWAETNEGASVSINWYLEGDKSNRVSSILAKNIIPTHRTDTLDEWYTGDSFRFWESNKPKIDIECDGRHTSNAGITDNISEVRKRSVSAFICIQGKNIGTTTIVVGERGIREERNRFVNGAFPSVTHKARYAVQKEVSKEITINVVEPAAEDSEFRPLKYAIIDRTSQQFQIRPLDRSFVRIKCDDSISVQIDKGSNIEITQDENFKCLYKYRFINLPDSLNPPFQGKSFISVNVTQERERKIGNRDIKQRYTALAIGELLPTGTRTNTTTNWAIASCPTIVPLNVAFGCGIYVKDVTNNTPPTPEAEVNPSTIGIGAPVQYIGQSPKESSFIACFIVKPGVEDKSSINISGVTIGGVRFRSMPIWIDANSAGNLSIYHSSECTKLLPN